MISTPQTPLTVTLSPVVVSVLQNLLIEYIKSILDDPIPLPVTIRAEIEDLSEACAVLFAKDFWGVVTEYELGTETEHARLRALLA